MADFIKAPDGVMDYQINWAPWLGADTISTSAWAAPTDITVDSDTSDDTTATVWLSDGILGETYTVRNTIETAGGRTEEKSFTVAIQRK